MIARCQWLATAGCALIIGTAGIGSVPQAHAEDSVFFMSGTRAHPTPAATVSLGSISTAITGFGTTAQQLAYEASLYPVIGRAALDPSVATGVTSLNAAIAAAPAGNRIVIISVSQGGVVSSDVEQAELAAGSTRNFLFIRVADPSTVEGIMGRNAGIHLPGLTFVRAPAESPWDTIIVAHQYEALSDWPVQQANLIADLNALLGAFAYHNPWSYNVDLSSIPASNVTVTVNSLGATTTRYLIPATGLLPILLPLQALGVKDPVLQKLQAVLKPIIDSAYEPLPNPGIAALAQKIFAASINGMTGVANQSGVMLRQAQASAAVAIARFKASTKKTVSAGSEVDTTTVPLSATAELPARALASTAPATSADTDSPAGSNHTLGTKSAAPQSTLAEQETSTTSTAVKATATATADHPREANANSEPTASDALQGAPGPHSGTNRTPKPAPRTPKRTTRAATTRHQPGTTVSTASNLNDEHETTRAAEPHGAAAPGASTPKQAPQHRSAAGADDD